MHCQRQRFCYQRLVWSAVLCLVALGLSGCSYEGALRKDLYRQHAEYGQKLPLKVALLADPQIKTQQVVLSMKRGEIARINVYPGLVDATAAELATIFDEVRIIEHPNLATSDDLVAVVRLSVAGSYPPPYTSRLGILFRDELGRQVALYEDSRQIQYNDPDSAELAAALTVGSLFILSPITLPMAIYAAGAHAQDMLEESLNQSLQSISYNITLDLRLKNFATANSLVPRPPGALSPKDPTTSSSVSPEKRTESRPQTRKQIPLLTTGSHVPRDPKTLQAKRRFVVWSEHPGVASAITETLQKAGHTVVERSRLQEVFDEQKIRLTHTPDDGPNVLHVGRLIGADRVVLTDVTIRPEVVGQAGSSGSAGGSRTVYHTTVAVRSVSVESGEVQWSGTAQPRMPLSNPDVAVIYLAQWAMARATCPVEEEGYEWKEPDETVTTKVGCIKKE